MFHHRNTASNDNFIRDNGQFVSTLALICQLLTLHSSKCTICSARFTRHCCYIITVFGTLLHHFYYIIFSAIYVNVKLKVKLIISAKGSIFLKQCSAQKGQIIKRVRLLRTEPVIRPQLNNFLEYHSTSFKKAQVIRDPAPRRRAAVPVPCLTPIRDKYAPKPRRRRLPGSLRPLVLLYLIQIYSKTFSNLALKSNDRIYIKVNSPASSG